MRRTTQALSVLAAACLTSAAAAQNVRAKADVSCRPTTAALQYDCLIRLTNARTNEPLSGVTLTVGADMPSMPMMHNVRPVAAAPGEATGTYRARLELEMHGDWAVQLNLSGPVRDRVVTMIRFEPGRAMPATGPRTQKDHRH
jgi:hypothetical protein